MAAAGPPCPISGEPTDLALAERRTWNATVETSVGIEALRVSWTAATIRWPTTFGDTFPRERFSGAPTCVPAAPKREAATAVRCAQTALGGEGHLASSNTPSTRMFNKHLTVALSGI